MAALSTLRTTTRRLINEEDSTNSHFTDSEINDYLNQAVTFLGTMMEWSEQVAIATAVQDQALYTLPVNFIALTDAYFDNTRLTILEREDIGGVSPTWQNDPSSTPRAIYKADNAVMGLYPAPDATQAGKTIQIQYIQIPDTLSQDTDVPDLHTAFQMCLPFYAAYLCDYKLGNTKMSDNHLSNFERHRKALMSKVQKFGDDILRFRWSVGIGDAQ